MEAVTGLTPRYRASLAALAAIAAVTAWAQVTSIPGAAGGGGGGGTPATTLNCAVYAGADDSLKIQACFAALAAANSMSGIADARSLTGLTWSINPFVGGAIPTSGTLLMPPGVTTISVPIVGAENWGLVGTARVGNSGVNYGDGNVPSGSVLRASATFPTTYATGTVTVGAAGLNQTVTGVGTTWNTTNTAVGCAFVAPAGGMTNNSTYGIVSAINSTTSITLAFGVNNNTGAAAGSTYDLFCPVFAHGNGVGFVSDNNGFEFGISAESMGFDANNRAGVVPELNWFGGQHSYADNVTLVNYCGMGFLLEGSFAQNSGPWTRLNSYPGTCGVAGTLPYVVHISQGWFGISSISMNKGIASTAPNVGIAIDGTGTTLKGVDSEQIPTAVLIDGNSACIPACAWSGDFDKGAANGIVVEEVHGSGNVAVQIANTNGPSKNILLHNIQSAQFNNTVIDSVNSCTIPVNPEFGTVLYALDITGRIIASSSHVAKCTANAFSLVSTSGPVADPGGPTAFQFNNAAGALTFSAPAGVPGLQRCYRDATGKTGAITIQMPASNTIDKGGTNGSAAGTLVSGGAAGDAACIVSDATNHWYLLSSTGTWTNN